jgi:hypothetical protein
LENDKKHINQEMIRKLWSGRFAVDVEEGQRGFTAVLFVNRVSALNAFLII